MPIRTVTIKIRIKTSKGKRVYANPVWETKGRLKPLWARVNGKAEHHPEGVYALRYGSKWEFCGQHTDVVLVQMTFGFSLQPLVYQPARAKCFIC